LSRAAWATLIAALLGWLFDGFEMGLFPIVAPSALADMLDTAHAPSACARSRR